MPFPIAFQGKLGRVPYALWSLAVFLSQHLITLIAFKLLGQPVPLDWHFIPLPMRSFVIQSIASDAILLAAFAYVLLVAWVLAALSFRRAADADVSGWLATFAIAPIIQIPVMASLCLLPPRPAGRLAPSSRDASRTIWRAAIEGVVAGLGLTLSAVALSTLIFGSYGYGVFVVAPFVVGAATAYFANREKDLGASQTARLVLIAIQTGGIALLMTSLEGMICIITAAPLGIGMAHIGGLLGRSIARYSRPSVLQTFSGFGLLPLVFALEAAMPATTRFDTVASVEVDAPAGTVWSSVLRMDAIDAPPSLAARLGVAFPLGWEMIGAGVGASRLGVFSTGTAVERVTEWAPERKLSFVVLRDVPAMRELSPYEHVHAPHVIGYFQTISTSFELLDQGNGRTQLVVRTSHDLKLEPIFYWLPLARWVIRQNNDRVLMQIKLQSERNHSIGGNPAVRR